nr:MAG TPA: hypothetical protein [Caudoviricetes sp.]
MMCLSSFSRISGNRFAIISSQQKMRESFCSHAFSFSRIHNTTSTCDIL